MTRKLAIPLDVRSSANTEPKAEGPWSFDGSNNWLRASIAVGMIAYFVTLFRLTFSSALHAGGPRPLNLVPFRTIVQQMTDTNTPAFHRIYELVGNSLLLSPVVLFFIFFIGIRRPAILFILGVVLSIAIEVFQYSLHTYRSADVDDVILNSVGFVAVYMLAAKVIANWSTRKHS